MAEWSKADASKASGGDKSSVGSNPTASATGVVPKATVSSSLTASATSSRIVRLKKSDLVDEMGRLGINLNGAVVDGIVLARSAEMLIIDGIVVKTRHGKPGKNVIGTIVVDEERDEA